MSSEPSGVTPAQAALHAAYSRPELQELPKISEKGNPIDCVENVVFILREDVRWKGVIALDEFANEVIKRALPPLLVSKPGQWTDQDDQFLQLFVSQQYNLRARIEHIRTGVAIVAGLNPHHELRAYLEALLWDGTPRLRSWLLKYLGADHRLGPDEQADPYFAYLRKVGPKMLVSAVARALDPGCQVDTMLVLEGKQGKLKSTVWRVLGGPWFADGKIDLTSKDVFAFMRGAWIIEWSELEAMARAEMSTVKRFLTTTSDRYRPWYGTRAVNVRRSCLFVGTSNDDTYLRDEENRRFWPVKVGRIDISALRADRDQLWAEATRWYRRGYPWWERRRDRELFRAQQERRYAYDAIEDPIRTWLAGDPEVQRLPSTDTTIAELLQRALHLKPDRWTMAEQKRLAAVLRRLGFEKQREARAEGKPRGWRWVKVDQPSEPD